ncbi:MAG: hypothetical protein ACH350_04165 [Parachlamydiaceae bacterium]
MNFLIPFRPSIGILLQASKWQQIPLLINENEMGELLTCLGSFWMVQTSGVVPIGKEIIEHESFLEVYRSYIAELKQGIDPKNPLIKPYFSSVWTASCDPLYRVKINEKTCLVKVMRPVVQLQAHRFDYSYADGTFRSMVLGSNSILWGIQFSYPHLYQDENFQIVTLKEEDRFPNTALFKKIQQWSRGHTIPTPFEVDGKKINVPIRLGKQCLQWINTYPQLQAKGLRVAYSQ